MVCREQRELARQEARRRREEEERQRQAIAAQAAAEAEAARQAEIAAQRVATLCHQSTLLYDLDKSAVQLQVGSVIVLQVVTCPT